jgi:phosphatidylserine/phosphatidylglycerophosphate/cardiolipin synthase-like enzyme
MDGAQHTIDLMSPNLNDPCVWAAIVRACERGVRVRATSGLYYNIKRNLTLLAKLGAGFRSNGDMLANIVAPARRASAAVAERFEWRWYARDNKVFTDTDCSSGHFKVMVVDAHTMITGSFNCDVFASLNSGKLMVVVRSADVARETLNAVFVPNWNDAVCATTTRAA